MPTISGAATTTKDTTGFGFLERGGEGKSRTLLLSGTLETSLTIKYTDDTGALQALEGGAITALPASVIIQDLNLDLTIVSVGGSTAVNVTFGGSS